MKTVQQTPFLATKQAQQYWLRRSLCSNPSVRLFCFPYAGGSSRIYHKWHTWFAPDVEVIAVELPGRGIHTRAKLIDSVEAVAECFLEVARPLLDVTFAVMGYSMGALIAFEVCRQLEREGGPRPAHLFAAAMHAPQLACSRKLSQCSDEELIEEVRSMGGTPENVIENHELMQLMLPVLRSDFRMVETYSCGTSLQLRHPITVFCGIQDKSTPSETLEPWKVHTSRSCSICLLPGDHFFIHQHEHMTAGNILTLLRR